MIDSTHTAPLPTALGTPGTPGTPASLPASGPAPAPLAAGPSGAQPYTAPAIVFRTPLEAVAASCYSAPGKADLISCTVGNS